MIKGYNFCHLKGKLNKFKEVLFETLHSVQVVKSCLVHVQGSNPPCPVRVYSVVHVHCSTYMYMYSVLRLWHRSYERPLTTY